VKRFGIVVNTSNKDALDVSCEVINFLKNKVELIITKELSESLKSKLGLKKLKVSTLNDFANQNLDLLISIGGDGTILKALHQCNVKIFGINAGVVGFLTEVHIHDAVASLRRILDNDYTLDKRVRLQTSLNDKILEPATNEAVIHTADIAKMRLYQIQVDGVAAQLIRADGIIIATPTGSTSYAMSAGGPILDPKVSAFIITPIAPFKLTARPIVVPSSSLITIKLMEPRRNSVLVIDGQVKYKITPADEMKFTLSDTFAEFVRFEPNFYRSIEEKLTT
jgi:NAD+ kinase